MPIIDMLLPEFDSETANTRKMLAAIPDGHFDYKPHEKSWTLARLASHIAEIPTWVPETINKDELDIAPEGQPAYQTVEHKNVAELLAIFDDAVARSRDAMRGVTDEQLMKPWSLLGGGKVYFTMPKLAVLRSFVMNHSIHHRAQLGVYLRLLDAKVPGMYGPSADEAF